MRIKVIDPIYNFDLSQGFAKRCQSGFIAVLFDQ